VIWVICRDSSPYAGLDVWRTDEQFAALAPHLPMVHTAGAAGRSRHRQRDRPSVTRGLSEAGAPRRIWAVYDALQPVQSLEPARSVAASVRRSRLTRSFPAPTGVAAHCHSLGGSPLRQGQRRSAFAARSSSSSLFKFDVAESPRRPNRPSAAQGCVNGVPLSILALAGSPEHRPSTLAVQADVVGPC
jgi:hypothetical protein